MRRSMAAAAAGMVLLLTAGCEASPALSPAEEDAALYAAGADLHERFATGLHSLLMGIDTTVWDVRQNDQGAAPITCMGGEGYFFHAIRETSSDLDPDEIQRRAEAALEGLDLDVRSQVFGAGDREQRAIVGSGGAFDRVTVTFYPKNSVVLVTASSTCGMEGSAHDLGRLVFADSMARDQWRLLPATEGPDSVLQFYFPADGPLYYDESGDPIDPQPVVTDPPVAPYGT